MSVEPPARGLHRAQNRHRLTPSGTPSPFLHVLSALWSVSGATSSVGWSPWQPKPPRALEREKHSPKHLPAKKKGFFRRYWWVFVATPLAFMLAAFGALYVSYRQIELPDTLPPIKTSYLYDRHGNELTPLHGAVDRTIVPLGQISENLQHAVIATEDAGFYSHPGVDIKGIITAAWTDLVKRDTVVGASTITQQLVKNVYAGQYIENADGSSEYVVPPRSIKEKIREALLSIKLETELGKDQILAKYLNTVYFGHGAYGAEAAAQTYFDKPASELDRQRERRARRGTARAQPLRPDQERIRQQVPPRLHARPDGEVRLHQPGRSATAQGRRMLRHPQVPDP